MYFNVSSINSALYTQSANSQSFPVTEPVDRITTVNCRVHINPINCSSPFNLSPVSSPYILRKSSNSSKVF